MKLPQEFLGRMKRMLGDEYEAFLQTYQEPRRFGLRVNTLKTSVDEFVRLAPFHLRKIPWTDNGFYYEREDDPARHPFYYAGLYYMQEPSAMLPAAVLPVVPGQRVLDLCAAPGGKATALAAKLQGQGLLVANEISASRARALLKNLEIFGVTNSFITNAAPCQLAEQFPGYFDRILVDAPCSGEGMFRKDMANARAWSLEKVEACAKIQREITLQAVRMLRPDGLLLYSTCTFSPEENEGTIAYLLASCPELELVEFCTPAGDAGRPEYLALLADADMPGGRGETYRVLQESGAAAADMEALSRCVRIFPHRAEGEGHFLAMLRKRGKPEEKQNDFMRADKISVAIAGRCTNEMSDQDVPGRREAGRTDRRADKRAARRTEGRDSGISDGSEAAFWDFWKGIHAQWDPRKIELRGGQAYYVPESPGNEGHLPFLRNGLYLGELRRGRFEPSQALAMALGPDEYLPALNFRQDDARVRRYLCGETVQADDLAPEEANGWHLVCVCGYPLGWGRLVNGTLKNKYHPGWRMQT